MNGFVRNIWTCTCALLAVQTLLAQPATIPNWWFSSDPKKVLADPLFPTLSLSERKQVLLQIDANFSKMSSDKQDSYIWNAETTYLPKAAQPRTIFVWASTNPSCTSELTGEISRNLTKGVRANGLDVRASLERFGFFRSHIRIDNNTGESFLIRPQVFLLTAVKPKHFVLYFEYPNRVSYQLIKAAVNYGPRYLPMERTVVRSNTGRTVATIDSPDPTARQEIQKTYDTVAQGAIQYAGSIVRNSLSEGVLAAGGTAEGDVYFERSDKATDVILRIFVADLAFDIPFSMPKR